MPFTRRRLLRAFSFTLAGAWGARTLLSCAEGPVDGAASTGSGSATPAPASVVARPGAVHATAVLRDVQRAYDAVKESWGVAPLPDRSWAATALVLAGLPVGAADTVDEEGFLRAVAAGPDAASLAMVFAVPLRAPDRLISMVTQGEAAPFRAVRDPATGIDRLEPVTPVADAKIAIAIASNHLIVGPTAASLTELGPFLADPSTVELAKPQGDLEARLDPVAAAAVGKRLSGLQARVGADLALFVELMKLEDAPADLREVRVVASITARAVEARVTASFAKAAPELGGCPQGRRDDLLAAPADATIAAVTFTTEQGRVASAERAARWLADAKLARSGGRAGEALLSIARARGATVRMSVERSEMGWLAYGSSDTASAKGIDKALDVFGDALDEESKEATTALSLAMNKTVLEKVGDVRRLRVNRREGSSKETKALATILLHQRMGQLAFATGADATYALGKALEITDSEATTRKLGDLPRVTELAGAVDTDAGWFVYVDPVALLSRRPPPEHDRGALVGSAKICGTEWSIALAAEPRALRAVVLSVRAE